MIKKLSGRLAALATRRTLSFLGVLALSTAFIAAAVQSEGTAATNVQLDDGVVWVTNESRHLVGRLNLRIDELDTAVRGADSGLDVLQDSRTILFTGRQGGVQSLDVLSIQPSGKNQIPIVDYRVGGGVGAVLDSETGKLWVGLADNPVAPDYPDKPDAEVAPGSQLVVTTAAEQTIIKGINDDQDLRARGRVMVHDSSGWREIPLDESLAPYRVGADEPAVDTASSSTVGDVAETTAPSTAPAAGPSARTPATEVPPEPVFEMPSIATGVSPGDVAEVTAVGTTPILLTAGGELVVDADTRVAIPGGSARLQQSGPDADAVIVASDTGLYRVVLGDELSAEEVVSVQGAPSAPVHVGACAYGAWTGSEPTYARWCGPDRVSGPEPVPGAQADAQLVWRVNQRNVALNSTGNGDVWADHDGTLAYVGNWSDVEPREEEKSDDSQGKSRVVTEKRCIDGSAEVPVAGDDQVGVRPRQSILDVLYNDDDYNCEPIRVASIEPSEGDWGALTVVDNGQHLLYSPSDSMLEAARQKVESFQFTYVVSDVAGNESSPATVTMTVKDIELGNLPPVLRPKGDDTSREMRAVVEEGQSVSYDVTADWWDPDGDDLRLVSALPESAGEVTATPDGLVRYGAAGVSPGILPVKVTMSDGIGEATEDLEVTVKPIGSAIPPVTTNDFVTIVVGSVATVNPLANDSDPNGDSLSMLPLWTDEANTGYRTRLDGDSVEITGLEPGTYLLRYEANDGVDSTPGAIMVTVVAPLEDKNQAPIAVPDQAKLRPDRVVNVDVLANDVDADGDTLSVVDVEVAESDPTGGVVRASIVDRRMIQVEVVPGPGGEEPVGPFTVTYQLADAHEGERALASDDASVQGREALQARGALTVLVQPPSDDQPPILGADEAVVRQGDIVEVPVLRNDVDPDSDAISLVGVEAQLATDLEQEGEMVVWTQDRNVMVFGGKPGRYSILYSAEAAGREASAEISIVVTPAPDAERPNQPPEPDDLTVRAIRGGSVRVKIPLTGIDPDGDSVQLLDELGAPSGAGKGNRVAVDRENPGTVYFTAGARSGAESRFTYTVRDRYGAESTATVSAVVLDDGGWAPQAHDDVWQGKPGRTLSIPVLSNDSSPQDRHLQIDAEPFFGADGQPTEVPVNGGAVRLLDQEDPGTRGRVEVEVPDAGVTLSEHYRISDGFSPSSAFIRVTSDPDAANIPPVAQPDVVELDDIRDIDVGESVPIDVLANDFDPDDAETPLTYSVPAHQDAEFRDGQLQVPLAAQPQTVLYRITDSDGSHTVGAVMLPGRENHPPELSDVGRNPAARIMEAGVTEPLTIRIDDIVVDPDGDPDIALTDTEVKVLGGAGDVRRLDDGSGFVFTPPENLTETAIVSLSFEVTDRPNESKEARQDDGCNCLASLVTAVTVKASSPPRVVSAGAVQVPQLDEPVTYDISPLILDDQNDPLTYQFDSGSFGGLDVQVAGSSLTITSKGTGDGRLSVGDQVVLRYTATDGTFDPVSNTVVVTIVATNKGQPAAGALGPFEAIRGETLSLPNLLDAAFNPFASDGHPLALVDYRVSEGGSLNCSDTGSCEFSSSSEKIRQFTVNYSIEDAVQQQASGSFEITMKGLPLAPGIPNVESVGDKVVKLTWTAADMQGGEFVNYHVTVVETGALHTFSSTGGEIRGLVNDTQYHFTVAAENELGIGESSGESTEATPDRVPDPPENLRFTDYGDQTLSLAWDPPATASDYSAIKEYQVSIGGQTLTVDGGTTELTVGAAGTGSALQNGTDYSFKMRARNSARVDNGWGSWGTASASTERPSRYPDPPTNVVGVNSGDGGSPRITVTWSAPGFDGGRAITSYRVCRVQDGNCQEVGGATTTATFEQGRAETASFNVVAINADKNRNNSDPSANSSPVVAVGNPDPPVLQGVTSGDHSLTVQFTAQNNSGCNSSATEFSIGGDSWQQDPTFTGLTNGTSYSIVGRTRLGSNCGTPGATYASQPSGSVSGTPYGPLVTPSITASGGGTTTITWSFNTNRADDGRPDWNATLSGDCGSQAVEGSGQVSKSYQPGSGTKSCTITVSAGGVSSKSDSASATVKEYIPSLSIAWGGPYGPNSTWISFTMNGGEPNASYTLKCSDSVDSNFWTQNITTNGSGGFGDSTLCYTNVEGGVVVRAYRANKSWASNTIGGNPNN